MRGMIQVKIVEVMELKEYQFRKVEKDEISRRPRARTPREERKGLGKEIERKEPRGHCWHVPGQFALAQARPCKSATRERRDPFMMEQGYARREGGR